MTDGQNLTKRAMDISLAIALLLLSLPILAIAALLVRLFLGSPIFFIQKRPGYRGRIFSLYKFRTMSEARDQSGALLSDRDRLTRFGAFLRKTSIDELPQLFNILRGEMSFVGPRPLLISYLELYRGEQVRRHDVLPGLTGWAQINGRNLPSWKEKFELDIWYVDNWSLALDFFILLKTPLVILSTRGVSQEGKPTPPPFNGTN
jgi:lipopolysaccharide/colanic/teichoic acid biosynthesis glycosyltransferase